MFNSINVFKVKDACIILATISFGAALSISEVESHPTGFIGGEVQCTPEDAAELVCELPNQNTLSVCEKADTNNGRKCIDGNVVYRFVDAGDWFKCIEEGLDDATNDVVSTCVLQSNDHIVLEEQFTLASDHIKRYGFINHISVASKLNDDSTFIEVAELSPEFEEFLSESKTIY